MLTDDEIRWRQIFDNYNKAYHELNNHKEMVFESNLEKAGYIHYFEIAFELANRVMFAYLDAKGKSTEDFREAVRLLAELGLIQNQQAWNKANNRKKLPLFLHKNEKLFDELLLDIHGTYLPELESFWERLMEIR